MELLKVPLFIQNYEYVPPCHSGAAQAWTNGLKINSKDSFHSLQFLVGFVSHEIWPAKVNDRFERCRLTSSEEDILCTCRWVKLLSKKCLPWICFNKTTMFLRHLEEIILDCLTVMRVCHGWSTLFRLQSTARHITDAYGLWCNLVLHKYLASYLPYKQ